MSQIRRNSIKGTVWVYIGFMIGALNTYLFTHKDWFQTDQYGLTRSLLEIGMLLYAFSTLGTPFFLNKFFPYYQDNLEKKENDILGFSLKISLGGFLITSIILFLCKPLIAQKFGTNSALLAEYFFMTIPLSFFMILYNLLEGFSYGFNKGVTTNFLKEVVLRIYTLALVVLKIFGIISFHCFMILFSLQFAVIAVALMLILKSEDSLPLVFKQSRVTKKFSKKIRLLLILTFMSILVTALRGSIDGLVLAARQNLGQVAIFGFAGYLVTLMQAPFRSISSITIPILSKNWKDKKIGHIAAIYKRSSINLLCFSLFIFALVLMNYSAAIQYFGLNPEYLKGKNVFILLAIVTTIEMGTGVNGQIIGTSVYWRFELWTSLLLTVMIIPLSYFLTVRYGLIGPALANLISFTVYNSVRYRFLQKKFNMQPFSKNTVIVIAVAAALYLITTTVISSDTGLFSIAARTIIFSLTYIGAVYFLNISPDVKPVFATTIGKMKKILFKKG